jgi:hypothetical protein
MYIYTHFLWQRIKINYAIFLFRITCPRHFDIRLYNMEINMSFTSLQCLTANNIFSSCANELWFNGQICFILRHTSVLEICPFVLKLSPGGETSCIYKLFVLYISVKNGPYFFCEKCMSVSERTFCHTKLMVFLKYQF